MKNQIDNFFHAIYEMTSRTTSSILSFIFAAIFAIPIGFMVGLISSIQETCDRLDV